MILASALFVILAVLGCAGARALSPCIEPAACRTAMAFEGGRMLTLYASAGLDKPQPDVRRALVVVHGTESNADSYFRIAVQAAMMAGKGGETLAIAPRFVTQGDDASIGEKEVFWGRGADWRAGDLSSRETPPRIGSFDMMNRLLVRLADRALFPNLATVVLAGHSAGGQFVQRYALGQPDDPALAHLRIVYVAANPSSYLYLDLNRPDPENPGSFAPFDRAKCQANRFKYGFENPNAYFKEQSIDEMIARYRERSVVYLLGESDTNPNAENLSRTCAAMAQGEQRFARGKTFMAYMDAFHKPHAHRLVTVPGVGHSARGMFQSPQGLRLLFE